MTAPTDLAKRRRVIALVGDRGFSIAKAAREVGIHRNTAARIVAASSLPFSGEPQPAPNAPPPNYNADQQPAPPSPLAFRRGYHDRSFKTFAEPIAFDGFTVERARAAISQHRQGYFLDSYQLSIAVLSFGPILAALQQRIAPMLALPRRVMKGARGLSRVLGQEVEAQVAPAAGLMPSPYYPPTLWGSAAITRAMMGFYVLQHAYGEEDDETGVRPLYTRLWPNWAVQRAPGRRVFQVLAVDAGPIDIVNGDGKFTLGADIDDPHLYGAIVALAEEAIDGKFTQRARASYIDKYGNPKWVGIMPDKVGTNSPEGDAFFDAMGEVRNPDGIAAFPHGSTFDVRAMAAGQSTTFKDALESNLMLVAMILLGQDGTMSSGSGGVYSSPQFGSVKRDIVDRDVKVAVRTLNQGHVYPWLRFNYGASIDVAAGWADPVLDVPLPDPEADKRMDSYGKRVASLHSLVKEERDAGFVVTQERVKQIAESLGLDAEVPMLAAVAPQESGVELDSADAAKVLLVDEARAAQGLPAIGDERGALTITELEAVAKAKAAPPPPPPVAPTDTPVEPPPAATPPAPADEHAMFAKRQASLLADLKDYRALHIDVSQDVVDALSAQHGVPPPRLNSPPTPTQPDKD